MSARAFQRIPYAVEVSFRTASSFLVAYSINLSRGGMFLETADDIAVGSEIALRFSIPGTGSIAVKGRVMWRRERKSGRGSPPEGVGVEFKDLDETLGAIIDRLVFEYQGVRILVVAGTDQDTAAIARMVRTMLATAQVSSALDRAAAEVALDGAVDAVILMTEEPFALDVLRSAKNRTMPIPVVAIAGNRRASHQASAMGADEVLGDPPSFRDFQGALVRTLGRPRSVCRSE